MNFISIQYLCFDCSQKPGYKNEILKRMSKTLSKMRLMNPISIKNLNIQLAQTYRRIYI